MSAHSRKDTLSFQVQGNSTETTRKLPQPSDSTMTVAWQVRPATLIAVLEIGVLLVVAAGLVGQLGPIWWPGFSHPEFSAGTNLYGEYNIPSAYNACHSPN